MSSTQSSNGKNQPPRDCPIVGIDLGTTYSAIGAAKNGRVEILANSNNQSTTPSIVHFEEKGRAHAGKPGQELRISHPEETIFDAKRMLGMPFDSATIEELAKNWPFRVVKGEDGRVELSLHRGRLHRRPEDVSAEVLKSLRRIAEGSLGIRALPAEGLQAVLTHPAYFNQDQKEATLEAAKMAQLDVVELLSEPLAAAYAYNFHLAENQIDLKGGLVLVFDLGGGTFDATIVEYQGLAYMRELAIDGDVNLGGRDFDNRLVKFCTDKLVGMDMGIDSPRTKARLAVECERAKIALSGKNVKKHLLPVHKVIPGVDRKRNIKIELAEFESITKDLVDRMMAIVERLLAKADLQPVEIGKVLLVGGATRMPMVSRRLEMVFGGAKIKKELHPDEAVAKGAAIRALQLSQQFGGAIPSMRLVKATPLSIGTDSEGLFHVMIAQNSKLPAKAEHTFETVENDQETITFQILEGVAELSRDNRCLGYFKSPCLPQGEAGSVCVVLKMSLDESTGTLTATAHYGDAEPTRLEIGFRSRRSGRDEVERVKRESEVLKAGWRQEKKRLAAKNSLTRVLEKEKYKIRKKTISVPMAGDLCVAVEAWLLKDTESTTPGGVQPTNSHFMAVQHALRAVLHRRRCFPSHTRIKKRTDHFNGLMTQLRAHWQRNRDEELERYAY